MQSRLANLLPRILCAFRPLGDNDQIPSFGLENPDLGIHQSPPKRHQHAWIGHR